MFQGSVSSQPGLRLTICGKLAIESSPHIVFERDFPARQGRRLWAYLVLERRRTVSRDELADALWGDDWPDGWDASLSAIASRLRAMLKPIPGIQLVSEAGGYRLALPDATFIDYERARYGLHLAESASSSGDVATALSEGRVALEIAARGFMPGDGLPWVELRRRQLRDIHIHAAESLAESELQRNEPLRAEREAEYLLSIDPLNENGYRMRMRAAAAQGNRAGVARAMTQCCELLESIAGMAPSDETIRLYQKLSGRP